MEKPIATKFVNHAIPPLETYRNGRTYLLREKLNRGEKMTREEKNRLARQIYESGRRSQGCVLLMGWRFDFSDVLKTFLVKQYGMWTQYHAPDKTSLRTLLYGRIDCMVQID